MVAQHQGERQILSILDYEEVPRGRTIFDTATRIGPKRPLLDLPGHTAALLTSQGA